MKKGKTKLMYIACVAVVFFTGSVQKVRADQILNIGVEDIQQSHHIKGVVTDENGPVMGASVIVKGKNHGTVTDMDGNFVLDVDPGTILIIKEVGYITKTVKAESNMKILLSEDLKTLNEVVVTALGIKRDRKALGYSVGEVNGTELQKAKETNVINSLAGKVAGLVVSETAGGPSGSTRVILRGSTDMTGDNQPLYVIDGVPLDNTNFGSASTYGGYDLGDGISSINPDDIESMSVRLGPWNKFFMLFNSLKDNEVAKIKNSSSAH